MSLNLMLLYLGRRGSLPHFTAEALKAARALDGVEACAFISRQNENIAGFAGFGADVIAVDTFAATPGALLAAWRIPLIRARLAAEIERRRIDAVIDLMPHVWTPLLAGAIRKTGARYLVVVHDAVAHPGDPTAFAGRISELAAARADRVITMSEAVAAQLRSRGLAPAESIATLFHPDLTYGDTATRSARGKGAPLRLLFFGRIMPYKGLNLFVDAVERLRAEGLAVEAGVFGEGDLGESGPRLERLGAETVNRWLLEEEIPAILARYDLMVVSHTEASQSGVVAAAFGAGMPVVATPVGGLPEQVDDGRTGLVCEAVSAESLAHAIGRVARDPGLIARLSAGVEERRAARSMDRFVRECIKLAHD